MRPIGVRRSISATASACCISGAVSGLLDWLRTRGPGFAEALKDTRVVRVAVNQRYVGWDHALAPGDEVALFPPVTGG